jgi:hypothetical protein
MSLWPFIPEPPLVTIHPMSIESGIGTRMFNEANGGLNGFSSATWPTASLAIYYPFSVTQNVTFSTLFCLNGTVVSGNVDVGVYTQDGRKIVSSGSTVQAGTSTLQVFTVAATTLGPGTYYMALALDNTTATIFRGIVGQVLRTRFTGMMQQATAFPLPTTATPAIIGQDYIPMMGLSTRSTI